MVDTTPVTGPALIDEPLWPTEPGPYLFLLEVSGPLEHRLFEEWIARNRPDDVDPGDVQIALLPLTRRRRRRSPDPRIEAFLSADDDPLLVPLRIVWLARRRHGVRSVGIRDLLSFGDPRDPDPVRQYIIHRREPERTRIIAGVPLRAADARRAWADPDGVAQNDGRSLADFVSLRAWLTLERTERGLRGSRYKVPKFPRETLIERKAFSRGVAQLARSAGEPYQKMSNRTRRYVREIAATHSPYVIDLVTGGIRWLLGKAYVALDYDKDELEALYTMSQQYPLVFLPSHKSNFDHLVLQYVLYRNGLPPNHTAGGINMNFFPVGPVLRRSGVFFIRREFNDNALYKFVLRQYLDYLLESRFPLEWYIEGGRSRSGKLLAPRFGLLAYVVESYRRGYADDVIFIPVAIAYDQIQDVGSYAAEQAGEKTKESFGWLLRSIRGLRRRYGAIHLRFGAPISLRNFLADQQRDHPGLSATDPDPTVPKLAFEVAVRLNEVTPITPISLVALVLLADADGRATVAETADQLRPYLDMIGRRNLPVTDSLAPGDHGQVAVALGELVRHDVVTRHEENGESVYRIGREQHLAAAYYRNTIIHFFVNTAITELALLSVRHRSGENLTNTVLDTALRIRDVLKFEFFFSPTAEFERQIRTELADRCDQWRDLLADGDIDPVLARFDPLQAPAVLGPFLHGYLVVAEVIDRHADDGTLDPDEIRKEAEALGKTFIAEQRIDSPESVSTVLFDSAIALAHNRGVLDIGDRTETDIAVQRHTFADEIRELVQLVEAATALDFARGEGIVD